MSRYALQDTAIIKIGGSLHRCVYPRANPNDLLVPVFTGDLRFAQYFLEVYCRWAVQEGLSPDQTLVLAVEHLFNFLYDWGRHLLYRNFTWEDFMRAFYMHFISMDPSNIARCVVFYRHLKQCSLVNTIRFSHRELRLGTGNFSINNVVGEGGSGIVYQGWLFDNRHVAVKKLKYVNNEVLHKIHAEVEILSYFRHPNLVKLIGSCLEARDPLLVFEFVPNGNLTQYLSGEMGYRLPWELRMAIAFGAADALTHLHFCGDHPVYHRDIKSNNILLDYNLNAKVADFGLSRFVIPHGSQLTATPQGTLGYIDPCYLHTHCQTAKSDVYSFGVVLLELVSGLKALDLSRPNGEITLASLALNRMKSGRFEDFIDPHLKQEAETCLDMLKTVAILAAHCLSLDVESRPTMKDVAEKLMAIRNSWILV